MKIIVCGDSFLTPDIRYPGTHFSEILANKYNHEVINLARAGISNFGICLQFEQAIKLQPDIIIYIQSNPGRMAIPVGKFVREHGLKNVKYTDKVSATCGSEYVGGSDALIVDDAMVSLLNDSCWTTLSNSNKYNLTDEQREAIKQYITFLYDADLQQVTDEWATNYWLLYAEQNGVSLLSYREYMQKAEVDRALNSIYVFHTTLREQIDIAELIVADLTFFKSNLNK